MPTSVNVTNLKINELKEAQYDTAVQQGVIGENELSILTDAEAGQVIQVETLPTASADELGNIYQFVGTTDTNYTNGYFYRCDSKEIPTGSGEVVDIPIIDPSEVQIDSAKMMSKLEELKESISGTTQKELIQAYIDGEKQFTLQYEDSYGTWLGTYQNPNEFVVEISNTGSAVTDTEAAFSEFGITVPASFYESIDDFGSPWDVAFEIQPGEPEISYFWKAIEVQQTIQYETIPEDMPEGTIFEYIGEDTDSLKKGLFYKKVIVPDPGGEYEVVEWQEDPYQPISFTPLSFNGNNIAAFFEQMKSLTPEYTQEITDVLNGLRQGGFIYQQSQWYMGVAEYNEEQGWWQYTPAFTASPIERYMTYEGTPAEYDAILFTLGTSGEPGTHPEYVPVKTMAVIDEAIPGSTDAISSGAVHTIQSNLSLNIDNKMENILSENLPDGPTDSGTCLIVGDGANVPEGGIYRWGYDSFYTLMGNVTAKTTSQSITDIVLLTIDFLNKATEGGIVIPDNSTETYSITYNATDVVWEASWGITYSDLSTELGISYTGTPADGDTIEITISNYNSEAWKLINGTTSTPLLPYEFYADSVIQYTGVTDGDWINGYFYRCTPNPNFAIETEITQISGNSLDGLLVDEMTFRDVFIRGHSPVLTKTMTADFVFNENENVWYCSEQFTFDDLSYIGITWESGTPVDGDTIRVVYSQPDTVIWEQVNTQPASDGLPDQTGNAGKFLTTDGTDASWGTTVEDAQLVIKNTASSQYSAVNQISFYAKYNNSDGTAATISSTTIGTLRISGTSCTFDGNLSISSSGKNIGTASTKWGRIYVEKINNGSDITVPDVAGEMAVKQVNTTITLTSAGWSSNTQTVNVTGMTATGVVFVSPDPTDQSAYTSNGILCTAQAAGTLTFTCDTVPSADLSVNVVML